jgi:hypothetical protein
MMAGFLGRFGSSPSGDALGGERYQERREHFWRAGLQPPPEDDDYKLQSWA